MSEWKEKSLIELADIIPGFAFKSKDFGQIGETVIKIKDIQPPLIDLSSTEKVNTSNYDKNKLKKYLLEYGDFVIAMTGATIGKVGRLKEEKPALINQRVAKIKAKQGVNNDFVYYSVTSSDFQAFIQNNIDSHSAQENISGNSIGRFPILTPPLPEQTAIASILSSLDDKINLLHRQNANLEKMAEILFRQRFVEPIKKIGNEGTEIEGFTNAKFDKWIKETVGGEWGKENSEGDFNKVVYCIRGTDIADLNTGLPEKTPIRFVKQTKFENIEPLEGDLILEISGGTESQSTGRVCYINQDVKSLFKHPLIFSNFCRMIRVKKPEYSFFLFCYIQYLYNQDEFFNLENGSSGIKNLDYKALLYELDYSMPNENLVLDFHKQVEPLFKKVNQNKSKIQTLSALRDILLPKMMSREVSINM